MKTRSEAFKHGVSTAMGSLFASLRSEGARMSKKTEVFLHVIVAIPGFAVLNQYGYIAGAVSIGVMLLVVTLACRLVQR